MIERKTRERSGHMLDQQYRVNPKTENYIIDIALDDYLDFFHEWDNAVFKRRDMHPELAEFLDLCSADIPIKKQFEISLAIEGERRDINKEKTLIESYRNYYALFFRVEQKKIKGHLIKALLLAAISVSFLIAYDLLSRVVLEGILTDVFLEGLMIGGWVFMWEALHTIVFQRHGHVVRRKEIRRFQNAPITFDYK
jgi:hypothetical protein